MSTCKDTLFVNKSLNESVYSLLHRITEEDEFIGSDITFYNFEESGVTSCICPFKELTILHFEYSTFIYAPDITVDDLAESLRKIVRHNIFLVLGKVSLVDNLEIKMACFTKEDIKNAQ